MVQLHSSSNINPINSTSIVPSPSIPVVPTAADMDTIPAYRQAPPCSDYTTKKRILTNPYPIYSNLNSRHSYVNIACQIINTIQQKDQDMENNHIFKTEAETILDVVLNPLNQLSHIPFIDSIKRRVGAKKLNGFYSSPLAAAIILDYTAHNLQKSVSNSHNNTIVAHIHQNISEISATEYLTAHAEAANYDDFMAHLAKPWSNLSPPDTVLTCIPDISLALTHSLKKNHATSEFSHIFDTILIENNFTKFEDQFKKEILRLTHDNRTKPSRQPITITPKNILDMAQHQGMTHHNLIQSKRFVKWMQEHFSSENPSHYKMLAFLTGHPCYTRSTDTDPNSMMNVLTLAGKLTHVQTDEFVNPHYIPAVKYQTWNSNPVLSSNNTEMHESKGGALVRTIDEVAEKIGMDPLFLCNQASVLMQINGWLTTTRDPNKKTPFGQALEHYAQLKENLDKAIRLARASEQKRHYWHVMNYSKPSKKRMPSASFLLVVKNSPITFRKEKNPHISQTLLNQDALMQHASASHARNTCAKFARTQSAVIHQSSTQSSASSVITSSIPHAPCALHSLMTKIIISSFSAMLATNLSAAPNVTHIKRNCVIPSALLHSATRALFAQSHCLFLQSRLHACAITVR